MALTTQQLRRGAREWAKRVFEDPRATATVNRDDIVAAIESVDATFEALASALTQNQSVAANVNANLPQPFRGAIDASGKAHLISVWAELKAGILA